MRTIDDPGLLTHLYTPGKSGTIIQAPPCLQTGNTFPSGCISSLVPRMQDAVKYANIRAASYSFLAWAAVLCKMTKTCEYGINLHVIAQHAHGASGPVWCKRNLLDNVK